MEAFTKASGSKTPRRGKELKGGQTRLSSEETTWAAVKMDLVSKGGQTEPATKETGMIIELTGSARTDGPMLASTQDTGTTASRTASGSIPGQTAVFTKAFS